MQDISYNDYQFLAHALICRHGKLKHECRQGCQNIKCQERYCECKGNAR